MKYSDGDYVSSMINSEGFFVSIFNPSQKLDSRIIHSNLSRMNYPDFENVSSMSNSEGVNQTIKKPKSAYFLFLLDIRPILQKEFPNLKITEMGALLGKKWRELSSNEKEEYERISDYNKQLYQQFMAKQKGKGKRDFHDYSVNDR